VGRKPSVGLWRIWVFLILLEKGSECVYQKDETVAVRFNIMLIEKGFESD